MELQCYDKFEYKYERYNTLPISIIFDKMNELGKEGWELINITNDRYSDNIYIFKRKIISKII